MKLVPLPADLKARVQHPHKAEAVQCGCGCVFSPDHAGLEVVTCPKCKITAAIDRSPQWPQNPLRRPPMREIISERQAQQRTASPMTAQISNLSDILKSAKASLERASNIAQGFATDLDGLNRVVDQIEVKRAEVVKATAELQAVFGGISNGGPSLDVAPPPPSAMTASDAP